MSSGLFPNRQRMPLLAKAYLKRMGLLNLSTGEDLSLCQHERSDEILICAYQQGPLLSWPFIHLCSLKCFSFLVCFKNILQHLKLILFEKFKPHIFQSYIKKFLEKLSKPTFSVCPSWQTLSASTSALPRLSPISSLS